MTTVSASAGCSTDQHGMSFAVSPGSTVAAHQQSDYSNFSRDGIGGLWGDGSRDRDAIRTSPNRKKSIN